MSNPQYPGGPPGYPQQQQGYPQQQQGYPQQQQGYPQQGAPGAPPAKKKSSVGCIVGALLVPILGLGGWLGYQHFVNWGYLAAPANVRERVDPTIEDMQSAAETVAAACVAKNFDENPLEGQKVLKLKNIAAIRAECGRGADQIQFPGLLSSLPKGAGEGPLDFEISIHSQDGFACMAPNFMGIDDHDKSDCVMWKGGRVHYYVERSIGSARGRVMIELD